MEEQISIYFQIFNLYLILFDFFTLFQIFSRGSKSVLPEQLLQNFHSLITKDRELLT